MLPGCLRGGQLERLVVGPVESVRRQAELARRDLDLGPNASDLGVRPKMAAATRSTAAGSMSITLLSTSAVAPRVLKATTWRGSSSSQA